MQRPSWLRTPPSVVAIVLATTLVLARLADGIGVGDRRPSDRRASDREGTIVLVAGICLSLVLATPQSMLVPLVSLGLDTGPLRQLAFMGIAAVLSGLVVARSARRAGVADLVVDLGSLPNEGLEAGLAAGLDDPTLRVGIWLAADQRYVDPLGRAVDAPASSAARSVTFIGTEGRPVAFVEHEQALSLDPDLRDAIARATALSVAQAALQAALRQELEAVRASRRRLMVAADDARDEIERQLDDLVRPALNRLEAALRPTVALDETLRLVVGIQDDLSRIVDGVHPALLEERGLDGAIHALAERSGVPVEVETHLSRLPDAGTQRDLVFLVSEALTNVAKHASATHVRVSIGGDTTSIRLEVDDDGTGGAHLSPGGGLVGMRDRAETAGGSLLIRSEPDSGTRLRFVLPIGSTGAGPLHIPGPT